MIIFQCFCYMQNSSVSCDIRRLFEDNFTEFAEHIMLTEFLYYSHRSYTLSTAPIVYLNAISQIRIWKLIFIQCTHKLMTMHRPIRRHIGTTLLFCFQYCSSAIKFTPLAVFVVPWARLKPIRNVASRDSDNLVDAQMILFLYIVCVTHFPVIVSLQGLPL